MMAEGRAVLKRILGDFFVVSTWREALNEQGGAPLSASTQDKLLGLWLMGRLRLRV